MPHDVHAAHRRGGRPRSATRALAAVVLLATAGATALPAAAAPEVTASAAPTTTSSPTAPTAPPTSGSTDAEPGGGSPAPVPPTATTAPQDPTVAPGATASPEPADRPDAAAPPAPEDVAPSTPAEPGAATPPAGAAAPASPEAQAAALAEAPEPPATFTVFDQAPDRVQARWTPPTQGVAPTGYRFELLDPDVTPSVWVVAAVVDADARTTTLTGLQPGRSYIARMFSLAGQLESAPSGWRSAATPLTRRPVVTLEQVTVAGGSLTFSGWALDPDSGDPDDLRWFLDGTATPLRTDGTREDVAAAYPGTGSAHGFAVTVPLGAGPHELCVVASTPEELFYPTTRQCRTLAVDGVGVGALETVTAVGRTVTLTGWAADPKGSRADVYYTVDGGSSWSTPTDLDRQDIAALYPGTGSKHGFSATLSTHGGVHQVCAWVRIGWQLAPEPTETSLGCTQVTVTEPPARAPIVNLEAVTATPTGIVVTGWAVDPDVAAPLWVDVTVEPGTEPLRLLADGVRTDVARAYPGTGDLHGFSHRFAQPLSPGTYRVCVSARDDTTGVATTPQCRTATVANRLPLANFESLTASASAVTLSGWAVDPDHVGAIDVHFYVNGGWGGSVSTTGVRSDVARAYPGTGDQHGFTRTFTAGPGTHQICTYAIDTTTRANTPMGCRTVTVAAPVNRLPLANFEALTASGSTVTLTGWALDPDHVGAIDVHFYVNGGWGGSVSTIGIRSDVARAYPGTGDQHGFTRSFTAGPGTHQICTYAIDTTTRANTPMGCRTVTVR
ncbi:hypothetical protein CCE01nite_39270 [Cellulomonas cellasea]|uniref:Fibronectin type-III domain-containing protein n=2 Tax=Cellulomonas cellasea TaxID=43670 RepID=A0A4Y3L548_9CELL|nr:hypothetical protein CCE01nite_39270 [Cellulomonas cellasea]